jgi:HK97 family phage major capsid protein
MAGTLAQVTEARDEVVGEIKELKSQLDAGETKAGAGHAERAGNLRRAIERREAELSMLDEEIRIHGLLKSDKAHLEGGSEPDGDKALRAQRSDVKGRALSAIEGLFSPDHAKQAATRAVESDDDPQQKLANWVVTASDRNYFKAFSKVFNDPVTGHYQWSPAERDAYQRVTAEAKNLGFGTGGGNFLVPVDLDPAILLTNTGSVNPMRQVARIAQTVALSKQFVTSAGVTASWDAEFAEVSDDSPTLTQPTVTTHKGAAYVEVSFELYEDSDIGQQVGALFADAKDQLEASAFTLGTGTGHPWGVVQRIVTSHASSVIATGTNVLAQADLYNNQAALPARWRPNARFMMT